MLQGRKVPQDGSSGCHGSQSGGEAEHPGMPSGARGDAREVQPDWGTKTERISPRKRDLARAAL